MSGTGAGNAVPLNGHFDSISATTCGRCETEIVVRGNIQGTGCGTGQLKSVVLIGGRTVVTDNGSTRDASGRSRETVVETFL